MEDELLDIKEVAQRTHYSARQISQFCIDGKIMRARKFDKGRKWLIPTSAIETLSEIETPSNWIDTHKDKTGNYPPLPTYLAPHFGNYSPGKPIHKELEVITPSGQGWNRLLPSQQKEWREVVEWLGKDPEDYFAQIRMMLPRNPPGIYRKRWKPFEHH